jgi:hypothetical protein
MGEECEIAYADYNFKKLSGSMSTCSTSIFKQEEPDLPLYWIPKLHKCPFKQRYIARSAKCSTKPLQIINMYSIGGQNRASELL